MYLSIDLIRNKVCHVEWNENGNSAMNSFLFRGKSWFSNKLVFTINRQLIILSYVFFYAFQLIIFQQCIYKVLNKEFIKQILGKKLMIITSLPFSIKDPLDVCFTDRLYRLFMHRKKVVMRLNGGGIMGDATYSTISAYRWFFHTTSAILWISSMVELFKQFIIVL